MRVIKQRLLEMTPGLSVFLECAPRPTSCTSPLASVECFRSDVCAPCRSVNDLKDISNLGMYITRTRAVLIFCSDGYCLSKNCMIELRATVTQDKPTSSPSSTPTRAAAVSPRIRWASS